MSLAATIRKSARHVQAAQELARRHNDGLSLFRAMPSQVPFFESTASEILLRGGNRCLAEGTLVATPSGPRPIEDIRRGDLVYSELGKPIRVIETFSNGPRACIQVTNRERVLAECSDDHVFLAKRHRRGTVLRPASWMRGKDRAIRRVEVECPLGPVHEPHAYSIGALLGDGCSRYHGRELHISSGSEHVPSAVAKELGGEPRRLNPSNYTYSVGNVECHNYEDWCRGLYAHEKTVDLEAIKSWNRESLLAFVAGVIDTDGSVYVNEYDNICIACEMQALPVIEALRYAYLALWQIPVSVSTHNREKCVNGPTHSIRVGSNINTKRMLRELDRFLHCPSKKWRTEYEPKLSQRSSRNWYGASAGEDRRVVNTYDIHVASPTNLYLLANGAVTHNSGKSTAAAAKFAAIVRDRPIFGPDGTEIPQRLPHQKGRPLLCWLVGLQLNHIGQTIHRLLFRPGLFKIIRDEQTRRWRAFDPVRDAGRELETKPSFPLVPPSSTSSWSWEKKSERQFTYLKIVENGEHLADVYAFASTADVKQGDPVDVIWIDERIASAGHYPEWQARLSDTKGRIIWSTKPRRDNIAMRRLSHRAALQAEEVERGEREKADVEEFVLRFSHNPFIDDEEKRKRLDGWSEEERKERDEGEFLDDEMRIYPSFDRNLHTAIYPDRERHKNDKISQILWKRKGVPPPDWTRDLILDPGTQKPAVLCCAIPPPSLWEGNEPYYIAYDEIYVPRLDPDSIARIVRQRHHQYVFQRFIIDGQAARQKPMGFAGTVGGQYSKAFQRENLRCLDSGTVFIPGDPEFSTRSGILRHWMRMRGNGKPQFRVVFSHDPSWKLECGCPNLVWQLENNVLATEKTSDEEGLTIVLEKPAKGQRDDLRDAVEYWASRRPRYAIPPKVNPNQGYLRALRQIEGRFPEKREDQSKETFKCGPGTAA